MAEVKCCWRCGRWGTRGYIESGKPDRIGRWECSNDRACARRKSRNSGAVDYKRGTVLRDCDGDLWRVSNRGNAYRINDAGHRLGAKFYRRLAAIEQHHGPLMPQPRSSGTRETDRG